MLRTLNFLVNLGEDKAGPPISVCFLLDLSGSMTGEPLEQVKVALVRGLAGIAGRGGGTDLDEATLTTFDSDIRDVCPWLPRADFDFLTDCLSAVPDITLRGGGTTRLWDGVWHALERLRANARGENDRVLVLFSDGGECASTERTEQAVHDKLRECQIGSLSAALYKDLQGRYDPAVLSKLFEPGIDVALIRVGASDPAWLLLSTEDRALVDEESRRTRRPVRVVSLRWGQHSENFMERLARDSGGEFIAAVDVEAAAKRLLEVVLRLGESSQSGIRGSLVERLDAAHSPRGDWFRVLSVNSSIEGGQDGLTRVQLADGRHPEYRLRLKSDLPDRSREEVRGVFRGYDRFAEDLKGLLAGQQAEDSFNSSGVSRELLTIISFRGADPHALAVVEELVRDVERANGMRTLFDHPAEAIFVVLVDQWEKWLEATWLRLYAWLLEIANTGLATTVRGVVFVSSQNRGSADQGRTGFASLAKQDFEGLAVEVITALNRWQTAGEMLSRTLANEPRAVGFGAVGAVSAFVDREALLSRLSRRGIAQFLAAIFDNGQKGWVDEGAAAADADDFVQALRPARLVPELLRTGKEGADGLDLLDGPDARRLAAFSSSRTIRFPDHAPGANVWREVTWGYEDFEDYAQKLPLDLEEYVSVCHSLDFFRARLELNAIELTRKLRAEIEGATDTQLFGDMAFASPAQARLWLGAVEERLKAHREGKRDEAEFADLESTRAPDTVRLEDGGATATAHPAADWKAYRERALEAIRSLPHPASLAAKYGSLSGLLGSGAAVGLASGAALAVWGLPLVAAIALLIGGFFKFRRKVRQAEDLVELYEKAHRSVVRREAIALVRQRLSQLLEELESLIGTADEIPTGEKLDPFKPENVPERALLEVFRKDARDGLSDEIGDSGSAGPACPFRVDLSGEEIDLPGGPLKGPVDGLLGSLLPLSRPDDRRRLLRTERSVRWSPFPAVHVRFVPPNLASIRAETLTRIRVHEIVREQEYRIVAVAPLGAEDEKALREAFENREWTEAVERLGVLSKGAPTISVRRLFSLWREVSRYRLWLLRLARLVSQQDAGDKDYDLYRLWKQQSAARRQLRAGIREAIEAAAAQGIDQRLPLAELLAEPFELLPLLKHCEAYARPPLPMDIGAATPPASEDGLFLSTANEAGLRRKPAFKEVFPASAWETRSEHWDDPRKPGRVSPFEVGFVRAVAAPAGFVRSLDEAAKRFRALAGDDSRALLLADHKELVDRLEKKKTAGSVRLPFANVDTGN